jgi:hypothetical protein
MGIDSIRCGVIDDGDCYGRYDGYAKIEYVVLDL